MRIAVLTNAYPPEARGGAGRIAALQVELLQKQGHDVRVWVSSLDWTSRPFWQRLWTHLRDFFWIHPAAQEITAWKPDVLMTHNLTGAGFGTPRSIQAQAIRWVHVLHDVQLFHPLGLLSDEKSITLLQRFVTWSRRLMFGRPDVVVSPTKWLWEAHTRRGWFKEQEYSIIPNPAPSLNAVDEKTWNKKIKILFVSGHVSPEKGSEIVKNLMQTMTRPIDWHIVGKGADVFRQVTLMSNSTVTTNEALSSEEILTAMHQVDLLLVPSQIQENQPTVLLEAFASGLPIVAQAIGGIPETLGTAGLLVHERTTEAWQRAIEALLVEPRTDWVRQEQIQWQLHDPELVVDALSKLFKSNKKI